MENVQSVLIWIKATFTMLIAFAANQFGILFPVMGILLGAMVIDFITGMTASSIEGMEAPEKGLSSKIGIRGIKKKVAYLAVIGVAMIVDWLVYNIGSELGVVIPGITGANTFFGLLVAVWFIINECISILENVARIAGEKNLPGFLVTILSILKTNVEKAGDNGTNDQEVKTNLKDINQGEKE